MIPVTVRYRFKCKLFGIDIFIVFLDRNVFVTIGIFGDKLTTKDQAVTLTKINLPLE